MRVKKIVLALLFTLLCAVVPSMAADYNVLVKNESTRNNGTNLYVRVRNSNQMVGGTCTALSRYDDGSFYAKLAMEEARTPTLTFYTRANCGGTAIATVRPFGGDDPVSSDVIITITNTGATLANSPDPITPPQTANPGGDRPDGPTGPGGGPTPTQTKRKVIRFFAPWTNTSAIVYVADGDSAKMTTVKNYCGWFEARITPPTGSLQVYFKQTIGSTYVGDNVYDKINPTTQAIWLSLDDAAAQADTIWVKANKVGPPNVAAKYPGILGDCPTKKLPVMMFDWLHGNKGDGGITTTRDRRDTTVVRTTYGNGAKDQDPDLGPMYATSDDFGSGGCGGSNARGTNNVGYMAGMVEPILGPNGVPVRAANFPENCKITEHLNNWFLPQIIAQKDGKSYSNATCRSIELTLDNDGLWLGQKNNRSNEGGLFLLDDFQYLDDEKTIINPFYDNLSGGGKRHNYGFTMKIQATFEYVPGQYFEFLGDDDVWVFIDNRLVVDIGGQHQQVSGAVDLDTLGLQEGVNYSFHIFYAERHTVESNFMMRTSIDLKTEASLFYQDLSTTNVLDYKIYQIVREQALACDFSASATTKDTVDAPSNFTLIGSGAYAEGVPLDSVGTWFGGITIKPGFTGFTIDTSLIKTKRALPPGTYQLRFSLQKDESQYDEITFVIDKYAALPIVYARVDNRNRWTSLGADVDGNVEPLNKESNNQWVNTRYPVNIMFEDGSSFDDMVYVNTSNPAFFACDENGSKITAVTLKNGKATFYVKATAPVQDVTILVASADEEQKSYWRHLSFMEPPVPQVVHASIFDRDGDGRGDSVYAKLNKPYGKALANSFVNMDSVQLEFGEVFPTILVNRNNVGHNDFDSSMTITANGGFGTVPFTGGAETIYSGKITPFWSYSEGGAQTTIKLTSDVADSIGPVITAAEISYSKDGSTVLLLTFSEGLDCENEADAHYFIYFFKKTNLERTDIVPDMLSRDKKNKWSLIFRNFSNDKDNIPAMGDSIKLVSGVHTDLLHRSTDPRNPFVRISGEQKVVVTSSPVVTIGEKEESREIIRSKTPTVTKLYQTDEPKTAKEVAEEYGVQGHYLGDMSFSSYVKDEVTEIEASVKEANNKSVAASGKSLQDRLLDPSNPESIDKLNKEYHLGDNVVKAYKEGLIDATDLTNLVNGNLDAKEKIKSLLTERTTLEYETHYYTSLGVFVNNGSGKFTCKDSIYNGNCLDHEKNGKLFLAWNMKSNSGRLVGTGVYIARLKYKITVGWEVKVNRTQDFLWGVRHGRTAGFDIDVNY